MLRAMVSRPEDKEVVALCLLALASLCLRYRTGQGKGKGQGQGKSSCLPGTSTARRWWMKAA